MEHQEESFKRWLLENFGVEEETVQRYLAQLTDPRRNGPLSFAFRNSRNWQGMTLSRGMTLLDLDLPTLCSIDCLAADRLAQSVGTASGRQRDVLSASRRTSLRRLMLFRAQEALPSIDGGEAVGPLCVSTVLRSLSKAFCKIVEVEDESSFRMDLGRRILNALLKDERLFAEERDLIQVLDPSRTGNSTILRAVALCNLETPSGANALWDALNDPSMPDDAGLTYGGIRDVLGRTAKTLECKFSGFAGFEYSELRRVLKQLESLSPELNAYPDWYEEFEDSQLRTHITALFAGLMEQTLRWEGQALPPAEFLPVASAGNQILYRLIISFNQLIDEKFYRKNAKNVDRLLELGLFYVEMDEQGKRCLTLSEVRLQQLMESPGSGQSALFEGVWSDPEAVALLHQLLLLVKEEQPGKILSSGLRALLYDAPPEGIDDYVRSGTGQDAREAVKLLCDLLVRSHWALCRGLSLHGLRSLESLIDLYRERPWSVAQTLAPLIAKADAVPIDLTLLTQRKGNESLLYAKLYDCLAEETFLLAQSEESAAYAAQATNAAHTAMGIAGRLGAALWEIDYCLLHAKALALQANLSARDGQLNAAGLTADFLGRCAQALSKGEEKLEALGEPPLDKQPDVDQRWDALKKACAFCDSQIFFVDSPARLLLQDDPEGLVSPFGTFASPEGRGAITEAASRLMQQIPNAGIWIPTKHPAQIFLSCYCGYLDSESCSRDRMNSPQEALESRMLQTIFSGQNIILTTNQAIDNKALRALAHVWGFQELLRTGHIAVSFFGGFVSLREYASNRMSKPNFKWSSLDEAFNSDMAARNIATAYLNDQCTEGDLPRQWRNMLVRFKEDLTLLDENLPARQKAACFQRGGRRDCLADWLDGYFDEQRIGRLPEHSRLHSLLTKGVPAENRDKLDRSPYLDALNCLMVGDLDGLNRFAVINPEILKLSSKDRAFLESMAGESVIGEMKVILSDNYSRFIGSRTPADLQHHLNFASECHLILGGGASPITESGCRTFRETLTYVETGARMGWDYAPEFTRLLKDLKRKDPDADADDILVHLDNGKAQYEVIGKDSRFWLTRGSLRTSNFQQMLVEPDNRQGIFHTELQEDKEV